MREDLLGGGVTLADCSSAHGSDLPVAVAPIVPRSISILGIESVYMPVSRWHWARARLAPDRDRQDLDAMTKVISLKDVMAAAGEIVAGEVRGRFEVDVRA